MFDKDQFIADCRAALEGDRASRNVREVVARAVSDPAQVLKGLGEPKAGGIQPIHRSPELTIINVLWPAHMVIMPHNHSMWAAIGVYDGREDNMLWRRLPDDSDGRIEAAGAIALSTKDAQVFGPDVIHSVVNPDPARDRRHPRLWRRFLRRQAQRMGSEVAAREALRHAEDPAGLRALAFHPRQRPLHGGALEGIWPTSTICSVRRWRPSSPR